MNEIGKLRLRDTRAKEGKNEPDQWRKDPFCDTFDLCRVRRKIPRKK
jgi:hypothetical protein